MYKITATLTVFTKNSQKVIQIPTFYVDASSEIEAKKIAREVIDANQDSNYQTAISVVGVKLSSLA